VTQYSLIVPVHGKRDLAPVLRPLEKLPPNWEILVVVDGGCELARQRAERVLPRARFLSCPSLQGASAARNLGAKNSRGSILVFLDSDVVVSPTTLIDMVSCLEAHPELTGLFGCYSRQTPNDQPPLSRFRNLLHSYVHRSCAGQVQSFWTGLGAIRRNPFLERGGFAEGQRGCSIEDVEFGYRLSQAGHRFLLEPRFEGIHLKRWSLSELIYTDIVHRAAPWTRLILFGRAGSTTLNAGGRFRLGPLLMVAIALMALVHPAWALPLAYVYLALTLSLSVQLARMGGWQVGLVSLPGLMVHHACCCLGAALGVLQWLLPLPIDSALLPPQQRLPQAQEARVSASAE